MFRYIGSVQVQSVPAIQFLYGADSLSTDKWEPRDLMDYGIRECDRYMALALECGARLKPEPPDIQENKE